MGNQAFLIAMMYWLMEATSSGTLMGVVMMASTLPAVLLGPLGGTVADRYSRKRIVVASDLIRGLSVLLLASLFMLQTERVNLLVAGLFGVALANGLLGAVFQPALTALIPEIVPRDRLAAANSMSQMGVQLSSLVGQALGGILYRLLGAPVLFLIDGLTFVISGISESFLNEPEGRANSAPTRYGALSSFAAETMEGLRFVFLRLGMRNLLLTTAIINFLAMPVIVMLPFYVAVELQSGAEWYGLLLAFTSITYVAAVCFVVIGASSTVINITVISRVQLATPDAMRGRVMSLVITLSGAITPVGLLTGGILGDLNEDNTPRIFAGCDLLICMTALSAAASQPLRNFIQGETDEYQDRDNRQE